MNAYELADIKKLRKALGLSQRELAKLSGLSQSYIAKVEKGHIDPSYSNVQKIFKALEDVRSLNVKVAAEIMTRDLKYVKIGSRVIDAIKIMQDNSISQVPVLTEDGKVVGMISESNLVQHMLKGKDIKKIQESKVDEFMDPPYPIVDESTPINLIMAILTFYNAVLVSHQGKVIGIITRSDILKG
jgi:Predicted transcriptional regulator with C-terminal CBS domains